MYSMFEKHTRTYFFLNIHLNYLEGNNYTIFKSTINFSYYFLKTWLMHSCPFKTAKNLSKKETVTIGIKSFTFQKTAETKTKSAFFPKTLIYTQNLSQIPKNSKKGLKLKKQKIPLRWNTFWKTSFLHCVYMKDRMKAL